MLFRMTGDVLRGSVTTLIWTVMVFPDSTVVTGDSRGQVRSNLSIETFISESDGISQLNV